MLTFTGAPPTLTVGGDETQVAPAGKPTHVIETVPLNPAGLIVTGSVVFCPAPIVTPEIVDVSAKSAAAAVVTLAPKAGEVVALFCASPE
jgi:hypothetical protein